VSEVLVPELMSEQRNPIELANLYARLRQRVVIHVSSACGDVSLMLPGGFDDELAFYRLVNWGYVLVEEAAKIPLAFLMRLPPLRADGSLRSEIGSLRTYVAHNLNFESKRDLKTLAFAHRWFKAAKLPTWSIYHIKGTPAAFLGHVEAPDEETAIKRAIEEFQIRPELQKRLLAQRRT